MMVITKVTFKGEILKASIHAKDIHSFEEINSSLEVRFRDANAVLFVKSPMKARNEEGVGTAIGYAQGLAIYYTLETFEEIQKLIKESK